MLKNNIKKNLPIILILLLASILRFNELNTRDIWYDEALSVQQAEKSWVQISKDVSTPIHYYILKIFLLFGKNTFILGLPSVLLGIASVFMLYLIGKKIENEKLGLIAAFIFSVTPMAIEFSQQILHYSYFVFFTLLTIYFFFDFIEKFRNSELKISNFIWLFVANFVNILTHPSAFIVAAMEIMLLVGFLFSRKGFLKQYLKHFLVIFGLGILSILIFVYIGEGYFVELFKSLINYGTKEPMSLGYSLSWQFDKTLFEFSPRFYLSMFSWYGLGSGLPLTALLSLSIFGLFYCIKQRKRFFSVFFVFWLIYPFVQLFFVRPSHWFEEKYFIFAIPVYDLLIAYGIIYLSSLLKNAFKELELNLPDKAYILAFIAVIGLMAIKPISIRVTYGFPVKVHVDYSWRSVYRALQEVLQEGDRIFIQKDQGTFFNFYFNKGEKNNVWYEDSYLWDLDYEETMTFIGENKNNYFATIPEFKYQYFDPCADSELFFQTGNFFIYKFNFKRNVPIKLKNDARGFYSYYDDFNIGKYISDALYWENLKVVNFSEFIMPLNNNMMPIGSQNAYIDYHFQLPEPGKVFLKPFFFINNTYAFKVYAGSSTQNLKEIYEKSSSSLDFNKPLIEINSPKRDLFLRFEFAPLSDKESPDEEVLFLNFSLVNKKIEGVSEYIVDNNVLIYDALLEYDRGYEWIYHTIDNHAWLQAIDGSLYNFSDEPNWPLTYKFTYPQEVSNINVHIKSYTYNNSLLVQYSTDGLNWTVLSDIHNNDIAINSFVIDGLIAKDLYIKFLCSQTGPYCQMKDILTTAEVLNPK